MNHWFPAYITEGVQVTLVDRFVVLMISYDDPFPVYNWQVDINTDVKYNVLYADWILFRELQINAM